MLKNLAWFGGLVILPLAVFALLTTLTFPAQAQGVPPHIVFGTAKANGSPVAAGSTVTAWGGDQQIGSTTTTEGGHFTIQVSQTSGIIRFKINGVVANETINWFQSGACTGCPSSGDDPFILTTADPDATPWPTPTPTTTPRPPYITSSANSGPPGKSVQIRGHNFKRFVPVRSLTVGGIDVSQVAPMSVSFNEQGTAFVASPPETDSEGTAYFSVFIPGLPSGDYAIEADIGGDFATVNFTITDPDCALATGTSSPTLTLSSYSGPAGYYGPIMHGADFKGFMPISRYVVGSFDYGPYYVSHTNCKGELSANISTNDPIQTWPVGEYTVEVEVAGSTASVDFTITPPPTVTLSVNSGPPGSTVTLRGENFMPLVPVQDAWAGILHPYNFVGNNVVPSPVPATNAQGVVEFDMRIPDLDPGRISVGMQVGGAAISVDFTITATTPTPTPSPTPTPTPSPTPASTPTPAPTPTAPQLPGGDGVPPHIFIGTATLNGSPVGQGVAIDAYDGGRLIGATVTQAGGRYTIHIHRAEGVITFRVNNQMAAESWTTWRQGQVTTGFNLTAGGSSSNETVPSRLFAALPELVRAFAFDNATKRWDFFDPAAADDSTLTRFIPRNSYWLLVSHTTRLLLNGIERDLFCVEDDCWNLIVW